MSTRSIDELILRSSFGEAAATRLRARTSAFVAEDIIRRTKRLGMNGKHFLVRALRELDRRWGPDVMAVIDVSFDDAFDFASLGPCNNCGVPGIPYGQIADWRMSVDDGEEGLHGLVREDGVAFHLDRRDACRNLVGHAWVDTHIVEGTLIGAFTLAVVAALARAKPSEIAEAAGAGAGIGSVVGAQVPTRQAKVIQYRDLMVAASPQSVLAHR